MRNEWITMQAKCLTCGDRTNRHKKDTKNCCWLCYDKTGALCLILVDAFATVWLLKFISNGRHVIGSYFDKLLGVEILCIRIKNPFDKLDSAYATFLEEYKGSYEPCELLCWNNPWSFFLDDWCKWLEEKDRGKNDIA
jgi:hypothetical protein